MPGILSVGTMAKHQLTPESLNALAVAVELSQATKGPVFGGLIGVGSMAAAQEFATTGVDEVFVVDHSRLQPYASEWHVAAALAILAECDAEIVVLPHTMETMEWAPILSARLGAAFAPCCIHLGPEGDRLIATRPICGGAVLAEYEFHRRLKIATIAPSRAQPGGRTGTCSVRSVDLPDMTARLSVLEETAETSDGGKDLRGARVVVSGGLGIGAPENWAVVEDTAVALDAAVGATRAAVEMGWAPIARQVGFSGQKVSPDLYIAAGISGAVHHLAGISGARNIVAINKDPGAPIFRTARFAVVGDAIEILTSFSARVRELRANVDRQGETK